MKKINQVNEYELTSAGEWPVTFEQVEDAQLRDMLKATPAQRLAMAEELLEFIILARSAKIIE